MFLFAERRINRMLSIRLDKDPLTTCSLWLSKLRTVQVQSYDQTEYAYARKLTGCKYTAHIFEGEGPHHILQFQAYLAIKAAFFLRKSAGDHYTISLHPDTLCEDEKVRVGLEEARTGIAIVEPDSRYCLLRYKRHNPVLIVSFKSLNLYQNYNRFRHNGEDEGTLTILHIINALFNSLFSRPPSSNKLARKTSHYLAVREVPTSFLLLNKELF
ncbi:hypothetical protein BD770DRAFT_414194 [Pilaira anomala]|nr:hypothetical protein BD770DRAFT_414194 [Pilaira anomala]